MTEELVKTKNNLVLPMELMKTLENVKLFYGQDRICVTDLDNNEIEAYDLIHLIRR